MFRIGAFACLALAAGTPLLWAQGTGSPPDSGPTPAQQRYADGLRTAARGVAQLRDGIARVMRTRSDSSQHRLASQRLGGLCGTARSFMRRGRAQMSPVAYEDSVRVAARLLTAEIDSVLAYLPTCQREAGHRGVAVANTIVGMLQGYDGALQRYRVAIAPPSSGPEQP